MAQKNHQFFLLICLYVIKIYKNFKFKVLKRNYFEETDDFLNGLISDKRVRP